MTDTMAPAPAPNPVPSGGAGTWIREHKGIVIAGVVIAVAGGYLLIRKLKSNSTTSTNNQPIEYQLPLYGPVNYPSSGGSGTPTPPPNNGNNSQLASLIAQLEQIINSKTTTTQSQPTTTTQANAGASIGAYNTLAGTPYNFNVIPASTAPPGYTGPVYYGAPTGPISPIVQPTAGGGTASPEYLAAFGL